MVRHWVQALHVGRLLHHGQLQAALLLRAHRVVLPLLLRQLRGYALRIPGTCTRHRQHDERVRNNAYTDVRAAPAHYLQMHQMLDSYA